MNMRIRSGLFVLAFGMTGAAMALPINPPGALGTGEAIYASSASR